MSHPLSHFAGSSFVGVSGNTSHRPNRRDRTLRATLASLGRADSSTSARIVLYRLIRRVERDVIVPILLAKVGSAPGMGV